MSEPGGGGGEDGSAGLEVSAVQNVADVSVLQKHLRKLVPLLLEDGGEAPAALEAALEEKSALEQMRKFLSDPQVHTVLVERSTLKGMVIKWLLPLKRRLQNLKWGSFTCSRILKFQRSACQFIPLLQMLQNSVTNVEKSQKLQTLEIRLKTQLFSISYNQELTAGSEKFKK